MFTLVSVRPQDVIEDDTAPNETDEDLEAEGMSELEWDEYSVKIRIDFPVRRDTRNYSITTSLLISKVSLT